MQACRGSLLRQGKLIGFRHYFSIK